MSDPRPRRRWPLVLGVTLGGLAAALLAGLLFLDSALARKAREEAGRLSAELSRPVEVGGVSTRLLGGLSVRATDVRVGPGPGEELPLLTLPRAEVRVALLRALFSGGKDVVVRSAEVEGLRVNVVRLADGTTNLGRVSKALAEKAAGEPKPEPGGAPADRSFLRLDRLALRDARLALVDRSRAGAKDLLVDHIDATLHDLRAGRPLELLVRAAVLVPQQNLELRLKAAPLPPSLVPTPEQLRVKLEPVDLAPLGPFLPDELELRSGRLQADLTADLGAAVAGGAGPTRVRGGLQATGLVFAGQENGKPLDVVLEADLEGDAEKGDLRIARLRLDAGPAGITGQGGVRGLAGGESRLEGLEIVGHDLDPALLGEYYPPLRRQLGGRMAGPIGLSLRASGTGAAPDLELRVDLTPVRLAFPQSFSKAAGARAVLLARLRPGGGAQRFELDADLAGLDLRPGGSLAKAPGERLQMTLQGARRTSGRDETIEISRLELRLPGDVAAGGATVAMSGPRGRRTTRFEAKLASAHLDLDRLLLPAPGGREGKRGEPPDPKAFSGLSGRAEVRVDVLRMRRAELTNVLLEIRVTEDEVVLEKAQAGAFGGEISDASGRVRLAHPNDPFRLTAKLRGVELGQAIAPFSSQKIFSGKLDGQVDLSGGGRQKADLAKTLAGFLSGTVLEGTFHGKDLVAGVTAPLARALPFGAAGREAKGGGTPLGKELPFALEFADGVARLKKPLQISRPEAEIALEGGFRLDGSLDMPATVALSPQTVASLTGGKARPGAPIPVSFRLVGPAWSPTLSGLDLQPAVAAILKEAGAGALGGLLGAPPRPAPGPTPAPGPASQDAAKRLKDEAAKRLEGLFGR